MTPVAILIVTYNSQDCIEGLLDSLPFAEADAVVVVDNGSSDATVSLVAGRPGVLLVTSDNVGYAGGINRGVRAAPEADAYLVLNPDTTVRPGMLASLVATLAQPGVGVVVPLVVAADGRRQNSLRREPSLLRTLGLNWTGISCLSEYVMGEHEYRIAHDVDWALGAAMMFSRTCYEAVGEWDESFFLYSEETDFCLRAGDAGWRTRFVPDAVVVHYEGGSGRNATTHQMLVLNRVRLYARRHSRAAAWLYWCAMLANEATWLLRGQRESRGAIRALLSPRARPHQLGLGGRRLPT